MRIIFIGASGHGKVCAEIAKLVGYNDILFLDDNRKLTHCGEYNIVGIGERYLKFVDKNTSFFVSIGNSNARQRIQDKIENSGGRIAILIHPNAVVSNSAEIGKGSILMAGSVVNSGARIGKGVIVNTSSSIDHDCRISDFCHIAVGAHLCGTVGLGSGTWIGAGAIVINNINICENCMIGAGAVVIQNINEAGTYVGIPAKRKINK